MHSDSLRIDAVELPGMGAIGLTFCPGKIDPHGLAGPHDRDLDVDIQAIAQWGGQYLVTLIEEREFDLLGVGGLGEAAERAEMDWVWLPLPDGGIPDDDFERYWRYIGPQLLRTVRGGGRVVVHCRGGLGRAGVVATRLMVELGWTPEGAIQSVRRARPKAVETAEQETYLRALPVGEGAQEGDTRVVGTLLGGALGDAYGYPVEFWSEGRIQEAFGPEGMGQPRFTPEELLEVSDDTQMILFTLAGLMEAGAPDDEPDEAVEMIRQAYRAWLTTQEGRPILQTYGPIDRLATDGRLQKVQAPGTTCLRALREGGQGSPEAPPNDSKGCGGVMRAAPVGLVTAWDLETVYEIGVRSAALTHGHPAGYAAAGAMAAMVRLLGRGRPLYEATLDVLPMLSGPLGSEAVRKALQGALGRAQAPEEDPLTDVRALGEGWVAEEALAIGVYAALRGQDLADTVRIAASHGGDSDSTASIAGQLLGARTGLQEFPHAWVRRLDVLEPLLALAAKFGQE